MEYRFPYWGPFLCRLQVEQEFVNILLEKGNKSREKKLDYRSQLAGMIGNEYYYKDYEEWFVPRFKKYIDTYINRAQEYLNHKAFKSPPIGWNLPILWINYQKAHEYNPPHNHDGDLSFVVYLQVPDEIKKENTEMQRVHNNVGPGMITFNYGVELPFTINTFSHLPQACDLFIFPAWLQHHVFAFKSDVERISVAGNITFNYS